MDTNVQLQKVQSNGDGHAKQPPDQKAGLLSIPWPPSTLNWLQFCWARAPPFLSNVHFKLSSLVSQLRGPKNFEAHTFQYISKVCLEDSWSTIFVFQLNLALNEFFPQLAPSCKTWNRTWTLSKFWASPRLDCVPWEWRSFVEIGLACALPTFGTIVRFWWSHHHENLLWESWKGHSLAAKFLTLS